VRGAACDGVREQRLKALGPAVVPLVEDSAWQVQLAAVQTLGAVREATAVAPVLALMRKGGRLLEECADTLFKITGMDFGTDVASWESAWSRIQQMQGWRIPTDEELAKRAESRKRYDALYGKAENVNTFGGIKTTSTRILFVIDQSGSMEDLVVEREKFDAGYENFEKLTIVKAELVRAIDSLEPNTEFNIAAFATEVRPWKKFLVPANVVNKESARQWVRKLKPIGGSEAQALAGAGLGGAANLAAGKTNTYAALMYPFGVDPEQEAAPTTPVTGEVVRNKLDTVFFLSDGRPSTGKYVDERQILREVALINEKHRIVFHVIAIGEFQKSFMKDLAEQNSGTFVDLGH
jgi:hypothetical protein